MKTVDILYFLSAPSCLFFYLLYPTASSFLATIHYFLPVFIPLPQVLHFLATKSPDRPPVSPYFLPLFLPVDFFVSNLTSTFLIYTVTKLQIARSGPACNIRMRLGVAVSSPPTRDHANLGGAPLECTQWHLGTSHWVSFQGWHATRHD